MLRTFSLLLIAVTAVPSSALDLATVAATIGSPAARAAWEGIATRATVATDQPLQSQVVSLRGGPLRFTQSSARGRAELLVAGGVGWSHSDEGGFTEAPAAIGFARGHDIHRLLLDLEEQLEVTDEGEALGEGNCLAVRSAFGAERLCVDTALRPQSLRNRVDETGTIVEVTFEDWRETLGVWLPWRVVYTQGERSWPHVFENIHPFQLAPGAPLPTQPEPLAARLADLGSILDGHHRALLAHREATVGLLIGDEAERSMSSRRGSLTIELRGDLETRLGSYFAQVGFSTYQDAVVPMVAVSHDGTLAWLGCEVTAAGTTRGANSEPVAAHFSWVELWSRLGSGSWSRIGNASSSKP